MGKDTSTFTICITQGLEAVKSTPVWVNVSRGRTTFTISLFAGAAFAAPWPPTPPPQRGRGDLMKKPHRRGEKLRVYVPGACGYDRQACRAPRQRGELQRDGLRGEEVEWTHGTAAHTPCCCASPSLGLRFPWCTAPRGGPAPARPGPEPRAPPSARCVSGPRSRSGGRRGWGLWGATGGGLQARVCCVPQPQTCGDGRGRAAYSGLWHWPHEGMGWGRP